jgi:hypothetical protein
VIPFGTDEWYALWVKEAPALQPGPGPTGSVEVALRRDDGTTRAFSCHFTSGLMTSVRPADPDADVHVEVPESLYIAICEGRREEMERAMLKGQMRLTGDRERLRDLVPALWSEEAQALRARIHEQTAY